MSDKIATAIALALIDEMKRSEIAIQVPAEPDLLHRLNRSREEIERLKAQATQRARAFDEMRARISDAATIERKLRGEIADNEHVIERGDCGIDSDETCKLAPEGMGTCYRHRALRAEWQVTRMRADLEKIDEIAVNTGIGLFSNMARRAAGLEARPEIVQGTFADELEKLRNERAMLVKGLRQMVCSSCEHISHDVRCWLRPVAPSEWAIACEAARELLAKLGEWKPE